MHQHNNQIVKRDDEILFNPDTAVEFCMVIGIVLLPMMNHFIHLNTLLCNTTDPDEIVYIRTRLQRSGLAIIFLLVSILLLIWYIVLTAFRPSHIVTLFILICFATLFTISMSTLVIDALVNLHKSTKII